MNNLKHMLNTFLSTRKKIFILFLLIVCAVGFLVFISYREKSLPRSPTALPTPTLFTAPPPKKLISPLQKTVIGKTQEKEINKLPSIQKKEVLLDGSTKYSLSSFVSQRPDEISTKEGIVIFERITIPEDPKAIGYVKISQYIKGLGQPKRIIQGSAFYGPFVSTYIYNDKGFVFIGNSNTDEVYEIQLFSSMSLDNYVRLYGGDIKPGRPSSEGPL